MYKTVQHHNLIVFLTSPPPEWKVALTLECLIKDITESYLEDNIGEIILWPYIRKKMYINTTSLSFQKFYYQNDTVKLVGKKATCNWQMTNLQNI